MFELKVNDERVAGWNWLWGAPLCAAILFGTIGFWVWGAVSFITWAVS